MGGESSASSFFSSVAFFFRFRGVILSIVLFNIPSSDGDGITSPVALMDSFCLFFVTCFFSWTFSCPFLTVFLVAFDDGEGLEVFLLRTFFFSFPCLRSLSVSDSFIKSYNYRKSYLIINN